MKRLRIAVLALGLISAGPCYAWWQSIQQISIAAAVAYSGPGDIVGSAFAWWGLRAYNAAYATGSNPAADVCDVSTGLVCSTVNILANGNFDTATAVALTQCSVSCNVSKLYDQTGNTRHLLQATNSARPVLTFNCINTTLPCLLFDGATQFLKCTGCGAQQTQPVTASAVARTTAGAPGDILNTANGGTGGTTYYRSGANTWSNFSGSVCCGTAAADASFHALQSVSNAASSNVAVDGTTTTGSSGSNSQGPDYYMGGGNGSNFCGCRITEGGHWSVGFSAGNITSMNSNQHTYWGF